MIVAEARKAVDGGTPTPFTVVDLLPEGLDVDDASNIRAESYSVLKNPDGSAYDPAKVKVEVEKNFNNTGRTLIRWMSRIRSRAPSSRSTTLTSSPPPRR